MMNRKKNLILFFACLFFVLNADAQQAPGIEWQIDLGGTNFEGAYRIIETSDGGYAAIAATNSNNNSVSGNHGGFDYWFIKLDPSGAVQWSKCFGGTGNDRPYSVMQLSDGSYVMAGESFSNNGNVSGNHGSSADMWVLKIDSVGTIQWQKCFGGTNSETGYCVRQTADGGFAVLGSAHSSNGDVTGNHDPATTDVWFVKLDSAGNLQWQKCYGGSDYEYGYDFILTSDGGYAMAGASQTLNDGDVSGGHGGYDWWIFKTDSTGNLQWQKCIGSNTNDYSNSLLQLPDSGFIVSGGATGMTNNNGNNDFVVAKLTISGVLQWDKSFGGSLGDESRRIIKTNDNGFAIAGHTASNDSDVTGNHSSIGDFWLLKLDSAVNIQWQKCLGGTLEDFAHCVIQSADGGYVIAGEAFSSDGDITNNFGTVDAWIVKLYPDTVTGFNGPLKNENGISAFPNPFTDEITIAGLNEVKNFQLKMTDMIGNEVIIQQSSSVDNKFNTTRLPKGIYLLKITANGREQFIKLIKI